jgi:anaerobic magnesium-protoporphyrin IX monomethyl ester cyclase
MKQVKLVLTQAVNKKSRLWNQFPMLGLGYLASYLEKHLDFRDTVIVTSSDVDEVIAHKPDIVGISSVTENFDTAIEMAKRIKESLGASVLLGGHHITNLPHTLPDCFDVAVLGEGEETLLELMRLYLEKGVLIEDDLEHVSGIAFRSRGGIKTTGARSLITPLDRIPFPSWTLLNVRPGAAVYMFSSRGCPYKCVFCSSTRYWQRFRAFSADYVVHEIEELIKRYKVEYIYFYDDLFIANPERLRKIVQLIVDKRINRKVSFGGSVRANLVKEETCRLLKTMGFKQINFGAESGSERVLAYLKGGVTVADNQRTIDLAHKYGLQVSCSFILGTPSETKEEAMDTYRFILGNRNKLSSFDAHLMTAFPGTPIWNHAESRGLVSENMRWQDLVRFPTEEDPDRYIMLNEQITRSDLMDVLRCVGSLHELLEWRERAKAAESQLNAIRNMRPALKSLEAKLQQCPSDLPLRAYLALKRVARKFVLPNRSQ